MIRWVRYCAINHVFLAYNFFYFVYVVDMWLLKVSFVCAGVMDKKGEKCEEKDQSLGPFLLLSVWNLILFFFLPIFMYA